VLSTIIGKGNVKVGCRSHTTTSWVSLDALPELMTAVLEGVKEEKAVMPLPKNFEGNNQLDTLQFKALETALLTTNALFAASQQIGGVKPAAVMKVKNAKPKSKKVNWANKIKEQPEIGKKTRTKGPVTWKFGSYLCHGTLLAQQETNTHCYARTHKGNVKTLKKGGTYWSVD